MPLQQMEDDHSSASWQTPVIEIIEHLVVIRPAFRSEMTLVADEKKRVFVMVLKFGYGKVVSLHERAKLCVIVVASWTGNARVIVKIAAQRHAENDRPCPDNCQASQEQIQVYPCR